MRRLNTYKFELSTDASKYASGLWELVRHRNGQRYWIDRNPNDPTLPRKVRRTIGRLVAHKATDTHTTRIIDNYSEWETYRIVL